MTSERSILLVDDDADVRESIGDALEEEGYHVATASNGKEALRLLKGDNVRPDLILLDMMMPVMDGWAFRAEQQRDPEIASIPIIVFTAYGAPRDIARQLDAVGFLSKPLHLDELLSTLDRVPRSPVGEPRPGHGTPDR